MYVAYTSNITSINLLANGMSICYGHSRPVFASLKEP
jgi:hypothetical protein